MAFAVNVFVLGLCLVISVAFQGEWNYESKGKPLIRRKRALQVQDFMDNIEEQLKTTAKRNKAKVLWIDFDGDFLGNIMNPKRKEEFKKMKITIYSGPTHYDKAATKKQSTGSVQVQQVTRCNPDSNQIRVLPLSIPIKKTNKYSWQLNSTFVVKHKGKPGEKSKEVPINMKLDMPDFANADSSMQGGVEMKSNHLGAFTKETTDIQLIAFNVSVEPLNVMKMDIYIDSQAVELPFHSELIMEGFVAARYSKKINGSHLHFYPVTRFSDMTFKQRDDAMVFNFSGVFKGGRGVETDIYTYDEELGGKECPVEINI